MFHYLAFVLEYLQCHLRNKNVNLDISAMPFEKLSRHTPLVTPHRSG